MGEASPYPSTHVGVSYECKYDPKGNQFLSKDTSFRLVSKRLDKTRPRDGKDYVFARRGFDTFTWTLLKGKTLSHHRLHHVEGSWVARELLDEATLAEADKSPRIDTGATVHHLGHQIYTKPSPPPVECSHCDGKGWVNS